MTAWTGPALKILFRLHEQICQTNGRPAADRMVVRLYESANHLAAFPKLGRATEFPNVRELIVAGTPYILRYRLRGSKSVVVYLKHGRQKM